MDTTEFSYRLFGNFLHSAGVCHITQPSDCLAAAPIDGIDRTVRRLNVTNTHARALPRQLNGETRADTLRRTGDNHAPVGKSPHAILPYIFFFTLHAS
jgi:hypothetical protein